MPPTAATLTTANGTVIARDVSSDVLDDATWYFPVPADLGPVTLHVDGFSKVRAEHRRRLTRSGPSRPSTVAFVATSPCPHAPPRRPSPRLGEATHAKTGSPYVGRRAATGGGTPTAERARSRGGRARGDRRRWRRLDVAAASTTLLSGRSGGPDRAVRSPGPARRCRPGRGRCAPAGSPGHRGEAARRPRDRGNQASRSRPVPCSRSSSSWPSTRGGASPRSSCGSPSGDSAASPSSPPPSAPTWSLCGRPSGPVWWSPTSTATSSPTAVTSDWDQFQAALQADDELAGREQGLALVRGPVLHGSFDSRKNSPFSWAVGIANDIEDQVTSVAVDLALACLELDDPRRAARAVSQGLLCSEANLRLRKIDLRGRGRPRGPERSRPTPGGRLGRRWPPSPGRRRARGGSPPARLGGPVPG